MNFKIKPYIGIGKILLGMTSLEIEEIINIKPYKFKKSEDDVNITDDFRCFHAFYNEDNKCHAIEIFNYPNIIVTIEGDNRNLFNGSFSQIEHYLKQLDNNLKYEDCGVMSEKLGISIYAPFYREEPNESIDAILSEAPNL